MSERRKANLEIPVELKNILLEFTISVFVEKPNDLIDYAANYFTQLRSQRDEDLGRPGSASSSKNSEEGVPSDGDGNIRRILGRRQSRRDSVCGERFDPKEVSTGDITMHPKTTAQMQKIKQNIKNVFLFRALDEAQIEHVINAMIPQATKKDDVIIEQGDDGDFFYVIESGSYHVYIQKKGLPDELVATYENSGSFGELALMYNVPRAATVRATSDGFLWAVSRHVFRRLVLKTMYEKRKRYEKLLESVNELKPLSRYERSIVCDALVPQTFKTGEVIFRQGDSGDGMYFIEEGEVLITSKVGGAKKSDEKEVARLKPGSYFGELALVNKAVRSATVLAATFVKVAFLDKEAFERLMGPCIDILKRHGEGYTNQ